MSECRKPGDQDNCAFAASEALIDKGHVIIGAPTAETASGVIINRESARVIEIFSVKSVSQDCMGLDVVNLGCVTCRGCVQIVDNFGELSVRFEAE
jgi:hypothetical protein